MSSRTPKLPNPTKMKKFSLFLFFLSLFLSQTSQQQQQRPSRPHHHATYAQNPLSPPLSSPLSPSSLSPLSSLGHLSQSFSSVVEFGAIGDGVTDNTNAFQNALDSIANVGGGIVWVPAGFFSFDGTLTVPNGVSLVGTFRSPPSHNVGQDSQETINGSALYIRNGKGTENGTSFLTVLENGGVEGLVLYYPEQICGEPVVPFPWTVDLVGNNAAVQNVECLNCFNAIRAVATARFYIARIQGQPLNTGVLVDEMYDIGRVENVHWNPWWCPDTTTMYNQLTYGRSFVFGRADWVYVFNTFSFGYAIGYHFIQTGTGSCNGNFVGIGADLATNYSVKVDASQPAGILIVNGEFTSFETSQWGETKYGTNIFVGGDSTLKVQNTAFWGPMYENAHLTGSGTVSFDNCVFVNWNAQNNNAHSIDALDFQGTLTVTSCNFQTDANQIYLGSGVNRAVVIGNTFNGAQRITNLAQNSAIDLNVGSS